MEEKIARIAAGIMGFMALVIASALFYFPELHIWAEETAEEQERLKAQREASMTGLEMLQYNTANAQEEEDVDFAQQLRVGLPDQVTADEIVIENNYLTQTVTIHIPQAKEDYLYDYPMVGGSSHIDDLIYDIEPEEGIIEIALDSVYEVERTADEHYLYLDFRTPQELYDKVVVIDAGHGGSQPGAIKQGVYEKDIDLAIVLELKKLFEESGQENIGVYYTRTDDSNPSLAQRADLANKAGADLFVSVHNNSTTSGRMSSISGTTVLYDEAKADQEKGSMQFATICLEEMLAALKTKDKGLTPGNEIYIIRTAEMPVALIEVGFMTNQEELNNLNDPEYQKRAAQGIYNAICRAWEEGY